MDSRKSGVILGFSVAIARANYQPVVDGHKISVALHVRYYKMIGV